MILKQRRIRNGSRCFTETEILAGPHNSDDLSPRSFRTVETQSLADCILVWKMTAHEGFVDDHNARMIFSVLSIEVAALQEGDTHRLKVTRSNHIRANRSIVSCSRTRAIAAKLIVGTGTSFN